MVEKTTKRILFVTVPVAFFLQVIGVLVWTSIYRFFTLFQGIGIARGFSQREVTLMAFIWLPVQVLISFGLTMLIVKLFAKPATPSGKSLVFRVALIFGMLATLSMLVLFILEFQRRMNS
jgi:DMSO/TMAO reductase YedYZ heme-binding membrane subunit